MPYDRRAYDDGSKVEVRCEEEDPPRSGEWMDGEEALQHPTADDTAFGDVLGEGIDADDDEDNGATIIGAVDELTR